MDYSKIDHIELQSLKINPDPDYLDIVVVGDGFVVDMICIFCGFANVKPHIIRYGTEDNNKINMPDEFIGIEGLENLEDLGNLLNLHKDRLEHKYLDVKIKNIEFDIYVKIITDCKIFFAKAIIFCKLDIAKKYLENKKIGKKIQPIKIGKTCATIIPGAFVCGDAYIDCHDIVYMLGSGAMAAIDALKYIAMIY